MWWICSYSRGPYAYQRAGQLRDVFPELFMKRMVELKAKREALAAEIKARFGV